MLMAMRFSAMIDTLKISQALQAAEFPKAQAEAIAEAIAQVAEGYLVTKADLKDLELRLEEKINNLELRLNEKINVLALTLNQKIDAVRNSLLWPIIGLGVITWIMQIFGTNIRHFLGQP